jgi:type III pantothenate kinase
LATNHICIDSGNTRVKYGIFTGPDFVTAGEVDTTEALPDLMKQYQVQHAIMASVRRPENIPLAVPGKIIWLSHETPVPIQNQYGTPATLGMDRLAAVVGANYFFPEQDCLVIDAGTCITFDYIDRNKKYFGGSISPGLTMKFKALHTFTGRLPLVEQTEKNAEQVPLVGQNTVACLQSGVLNGTLAEVDGMIAAYLKQSPDLITVMCGGDAPFFETNLKARIFAVPDLVLIGLNRILNYNV